MWSFKKSQATITSFLGLMICEQELACVVVEPGQEGGICITKHGTVSYSGIGELGSALQNLVAQYGLANTSACLVLSPKDYQLFMIDAPAENGQDPRGAALFQIKDLVEFPVDDCVVDTFSPSPDVKTYFGKLHVAVTKKSLLLPTRKILDFAQIEVKTITIPELMIRNVVVAAGLQEENLGVLVKVAERYLLAVVNNGNLNFFRWLPDNLSEEMSRSIDYYTASLKQKMFAKLYVVGASTEDYDLISQQLAGMPFTTLLFDITQYFSFVDQPTGTCDTATFFALGAAIDNLEQGVGIETAD